MWATYLMGAAVAGPMVGLAAAVLLATSPVFLYQLMSPMSDVPVTAWWALCLALLPFKRRDATLAAGLFAGIAILTRPNLVPILAVPGLFLLWAVISERSQQAAGRAASVAVCSSAPSRRASLWPISMRRWYGGVLNNGYGAFDYLYGLENLWPNVTRYSGWLLDSQTPVVLLAVIAPFLLRPQAGPDSGTYGPRALAVTWLLFIAAVGGCYVFYATFDAWWYLRFFLPAFPAMLVLTSHRVDRRSRRGRRARQAGSSPPSSWRCWRGTACASRATTRRSGSAKASASTSPSAKYIGDRLPERAVISAMQYSGSIRYYSGRLTVRYDWIPPNRLDSVIEQLRGLGYHPYIVLEAVEMNAFERRFQENSELGTLDWTPRAQLRHNSDVRIYDPADKRSGPDHQPITDFIN